MDQLTLTRAPEYKIAGTVAPEAHSFEHAGRRWYVHRFVDNKGKAAVRFRDNWQVSTDGIPATLTVATHAEAAAEWFIETFERCVRKFGSENFDREITDVLKYNLGRLLRPKDFSPR